MKTNRVTPFVIAAFALVAFPAAGCAEKEKAPVPPAKETAAAPTVAQPASPINAPDMATAGPDVALAGWSDIKDFTYDTRAQLFAGLERLEAKVEGQISELVAKRTTLPATTDTRAWDFAMKEMENASSYLKSVGAELRTAPRETWDQQKDKVGRAWVRTQEAYSAVKASTTS